MIDIAITLNGDVIAAATDIDLSLTANLRQIERVPTSASDVWQRFAVDGRAISLSQKSFYTDNFDVLTMAANLSNTVQINILFAGNNIRCGGVIKSYKSECIVGSVGRVSLDIDVYPL